ncbi:MAG: ABC transporter permease [Archangiaceae bacterium]|nr:ABC transporter permease [Archangiaceae bacterium]
MKPRWAKVAGDLRSERGRLLLMLVAVAVSLAAIGTVLGSWAILTRDIASNYLGTAPAEATLEFEGGVSDEVLTRARADQAVSVADRREVIAGRVRVGDDFRPLLLFVPERFETMRLNTFRPLDGAWPPPAGTVLLERSGLEMANATMSSSLRVKLPNGRPSTVTVSGLVHDPGLAPAWQERTVYAYATPETVAMLGESPTLHELRVQFASHPRTVVEAENEASALAARLGGVHQLRVPPPRQHPHQRQMETILLLLLIFAGLSLVLSSVLVATTLAAILARQVREIGVMKSIGATRAQLAGMYAVMVGSICGVAVLLAAPLSMLGAFGLSRVVSTMLNFDLTSRALPWWVLLVLVVAGVLVPLLFAAIPIRRAVTIPVRAALDTWGVGERIIVRPWFPVAVRNLLRRPGRLALTVGLLATAGALFMTALAVSRAWERNLEKVKETRHYDLEVRFNTPAPDALATTLQQTVEGVRLIEPWGFEPAALARPGAIDVVRTYPDRGHGSFSVLAPPPSTTLISLPLLQGRWLASGERAVVLNHVAFLQARTLKVGDDVALSIDGVPSTWKLAGVVEEVGSAGVAYLPSDVFASSQSTQGRSRLWRVVTAGRDDLERATVIRRLEEALSREAVSVETVTPFAELKTAIGDHVAVLIRALLALAMVLALVGVLGLTSAVGTSVIERSREIAVMKTLGATSAVVRRLVVSEALVSSALSFVVALVLSLPLTLGIERLLGMLSFLAPLPFVVSWVSMGLWFALLVVATLGATLLPIRRAVQLTVREGLS